MTTLVKQPRTYFMAGYPAYPGFPGSPGIPAQGERTWTETITHRVCDDDDTYVPPNCIRLQSGELFCAAYPPGFFSGDISSLGTPDSSSGLAGASCHTVTETITHYDPGHPEVPAVPPIPPAPASPDQIFTDLRIGWNAGARSIATIGSQESKAFRFQVPTACVGAFVGITTTGELTLDPYGFTYAFEFDHGSMRCWAKGEVVTEWEPYTNNDYFLLVRRAGTLIMSKGE